MQEEQRQEQALLMVMQVQQLRVKQSLTILIIHLLTSRVTVLMDTIKPILPQLSLMAVMFHIPHKVYTTIDMFIMPYMLTHPVVMVHMVMELDIFTIVPMVIIMDILHTMLLRIQQIFIIKMVLVTTTVTEINRV